MKGKKFPKYTIDQSHKHELFTNIKRESDTHIFDKPKKRVKQNFLMPLISTITVFLFVLAVGYYSYTNINESTQKNATINSQENFTVDLPPDVSLEKVEKDSYQLLASSKVIGGIRLIDQEEKQRILSDGGIIEESEVLGLQYPTQKSILHIKRENIIQTLHYFIKPYEENNEEYNIYFHFSDSSYHESNKAGQYEEMVQSFRVSNSDLMTQNIIPPTISSNGMKIKTLRGSYSWSENGKAVATDYAGPIELVANQKPFVLNKKDKVEITFSKNTKQVELQRWDTTTPTSVPFQVEDTVYTFLVPQQAGEYTYSLNVTYDKGEAEFAFNIKVN